MNTVRCRPLGYSFAKNRSGTPLFDARMILNSNHPRASAFSVASDSILLSSVTEGLRQVFVSGP